MRRPFVLMFMLLLFTAYPCYAGFLDNFMKNRGLTSRQATDDTTVISGLKEALTIGTENAVKEVSQVDGYLSNDAIRILMPEKVQKVGEVLNKIGYGKQVDSFISSMNRAAEKAAPKAASHIIDSVRQMTFEDAKKILHGGDTAATDYFKAKTSGALYNEFKPVISSTMNEVGVTRSYKEMMGKYTALPFMKEESLDLDHYVTNKSLDGLFYMIAQEESAIRNNPSARVTELLRTVFGK
jgi:hypothetical protein